jgi:hypothetical protein
MLHFRQRPDRRVILALVVALVLAVVAAGWAMRAGRLRSSVAPTPAPPGAPGPAGAPGVPGTALPSPAPR